MADSKSFLFVADRLWLDFVNTEIRTREGRVDLLSDTTSILAWLKAAGLGAATWTEEDRERLHKFRAALRNLAQRLADGEAVPAASLQAINTILAARSGYPEIVSAKDSQFVRQEHWALHSPLGLLAPVAEDAAWTLCDGDSARVRKCENPDCILFFYDTSKNHTRRWCSMAGCGNRAKAAAYYRRTHAKKEVKELTTQ